MKMMYYPEGSEDALTTLGRVSREYGENSDYVLAGGGNTSCKVDGLMYVKASGTQLATIEEDGFTGIDLEKLNLIWKVEYPEDKDIREEAVLSDLMNSRVDPEGRRPSVETLLHGLFPYTFVIHTHPALINGLTCSEEGECKAKEIFGDSVVWIPVIDPGYILALEVKKAVEKHREKTGLFPRIVLLQNHGVFVAADSVGEVRKLYDELFQSLLEQVGKKQEDRFVVSDKATLKKAADDLKAINSSCFCILAESEDLKPFLSSFDDFSPLAASITPDHIVYSGYRPLWIESPDDLKEEVVSFEKKEGFFPRIIVLKGEGVIACHDSLSRTETALKLFGDNLKIALYTKVFGGIHFMPKENVDFIRNWEVEKYRASQAK